MIHSTRYMATALAIATAFVIFNIIAVAQGSADAYYRGFEQLIINILPTF